MPYYRTSRPARILPERRAGALTPIIGAGWLIILSCAMRTTAATEDDVRCAEYVLLGIEEGRQRLRSGAYRATGRLEVDWPNGVAYQGDMEIFCAFNHDENALRFDRSLPIQMELGPGEASEEELRKGYRVVPFRSKLIRLQDAQRLWTTLSGGVQIKRPDETLEQDARPLDVAALGLMITADFLRGVTFRQIMETLRKDPVAACQEEGDGIYKVEWLYGPFRRAIWVNAQQGFTAFRTECGEQTDGNWTRTAPTACDVTWKELGGVWVPTALVLREPFAEGKFQQYDLAFDWMSVNQPVAERYFGIDDFNAPVGTLVVDSRLGDPVVVRTIGRPAPDADVKPRGSTHVYIWILVCANIAVILFVGLLALRRWRLRASRDA